MRNRPLAADALVVIADQPQMPALAAHIGDLKHRAEHFLLDIEVVGEHAAALEIRVDHLQRAAHSRRRVERRGQVDVLRDVHGLRERRIANPAA